MKQQIGGRIHMAGGKHPRIAFKLEPPVAEIIGKCLDLMREIGILDKIMTHSDFILHYLSPPSFSPGRPFKSPAAGGRDIPAARLNKPPLAGAACEIPPSSPPSGGNMA